MDLLQSAALLVLLAGGALLLFRREDVNKRAAGPRVAFIGNSFTCRASLSKG